MGVNLTIDQGNSQAKIVVWEHTRPIVQEETPDPVGQRLRDLVIRYRPERALCCSVTGNGVRVAEWLCGLGVDARHLSTDMPMPLTIGYDNPHRLGEDRVAAAVGAWSLFPGSDILVVDMGTAVTYDFVDHRGVFVGGNIAPGIGMRLRSLHSFTARLPQVDGYGDTPLLGTDTSTAMRAGAVRGVVAEIRYYREHLPKDTRVVITGGWSQHVSSFLDFPATLDKCLVNKGLLSILLHDESN